jgi:hypothetical protein
MAICDEDSPGMDIPIDSLESNDRGLTGNTYSLYPVEDSPDIHIPTGTHQNQDTAAVTGNVFVRRL